MTKQFAKYMFHRLFVLNVDKMSTVGYRFGYL